MNKKMKLPFLSTVTPSTSSSDHHHHQYSKTPPSPWQWPACGHLETLSFRATAQDACTSNPSPTPAAAVETSDIDMGGNETPVSCFAISYLESSRSFSTRSEESGSDQIETVIRGLRSDRLFFEPAESNSILEEANKDTTATATTTCTSIKCSFDLVPYKESVFLSMESSDPFNDFRNSMEEMIEAHGLKDWEGLEELLDWYLKVNGKSNHGCIIGAFVDLLITLSSSSYPSTCLMSSVLGSSSERTETTAMATATSSSPFSCISPSSPLSLPSSSLTTPCLSSLNQVDDDDDDEKW